MSEHRVAYRYALALLGVAEEAKALDQVSQDLASLELLLKESRDFDVFLKSPVVSREKKLRVLKELFDGKLGTTVTNFLQTITTKGREGILPEIVAQFHRLRDERMGILNVTARTVVPFKPEQERLLVSQLEVATKKKIRISYVIDPSLRGGFTVQHEDTVWDASVQRQLDRLRERFVAGAAEV